jgi:hypothetical protein
VKAFDDKLAKLGYQAKAGASKPKKSHHKQPPSADIPATPKAKPKA